MQHFKTTFHFGVVTDEKKIHNHCLKSKGASRVAFFMRINAKVRNIVQKKPRKIKQITLIIENTL